MSATPPTDPLAQAFQLTKLGRWTDAEHACRALIADRPGDARPHALLARVLAQLGRADEAHAEIERALAIDPTFVPALVERAGLARAAGDHATVVASLDTVLRAVPNQAAMWCDLAVSLIELGRRTEARAALQKACALSTAPVGAKGPAFALPRFHLARLDFLEARFPDAADGFRAAAYAKPDWVEAWVNLGQAETKLDRLIPAAQAFQKAVDLAPDHRVALDGLATALQHARAGWSTQLDARRRLAALEPCNGRAWELLAETWLREQHHEEAAAAAGRAIAGDPHLLSARWMRFQTPAKTVYESMDDLADFERQWTAGLAEFEALDLDAPAVAGRLYPLLAQSTNFYLHYLGKPFVDEQRRYAKLVQRMTQRFVRAPAPVERPRDGRTRVLFASPFLRRHTVAKLFVPMFLALDRREFELSALHFDALSDEVTERVKANVDFFAMGEPSPQDWADAIAKRAPDVIVYLDIGMHPMPQILASLRLAPVQAVLWGHPVTTGLDTMDVFLTSDAMERDGGEADYTERLVRLPNLGTRYAAPTLAPRADFDVPARRDADAVHFFFAQSSPKFHPHHDDVFARIAQRLPQARFSFVPHRYEHGRARIERRIGAAFAARGLDAAKHVHCFAHLAQDEFFAVARAADVNLDSIGWSGGNTTLEILWFDTPTVTLPGELMRSRHTAAILRRLGLDELIAKDVDDYVRLAVELGRNAAWRAELRAKIAARKLVLYDDDAVVAGLREFLLGSDGKPPRVD